MIRRFTSVQFSQENNRWTSHYPHFHCCIRRRQVTWYDTALGFGGSSITWRGSVQRVIGTYSSHGNSLQENRITFNFNGSISRSSDRIANLLISLIYTKQILTHIYIYICINILFPSWWTLLMNFHEILRVRNKDSYTFIFLVYMYMICFSLFLFISLHARKWIYSRKKIWHF